MDIIVTRFKEKTGPQGEIHFGEFMEIMPKEVIRVEAPPIQFKPVHKNAKIPEYATPGSAGFDFYAVEDAVIPGIVIPESVEIREEFGINPDSDFFWDYPGKTVGVQTILVPLGFEAAIPPGWQVAIRNRSGMANKSIVVMNADGTIDSDYRGEWKIMLGNLTAGPIRIKAGDRVAQGVLEIAPQATFVEVDDLDDTERGSGGFGSTGK
jgi:dUTP pyrophosphatase